MWHDVRALNATASTLLAATLLASIASGVWWLSQRPMFTLRAVTVESLYGMDLRHVNELTVRNSVLREALEEANSPCGHTLARFCAILGAVAGDIGWPSNFLASSIQALSWARARSLALAATRWLSSLM